MLEARKFPLHPYTTGRLSGLLATTRSTANMPNLFWPQLFLSDFHHER